MRKNRIEGVIAALVLILAFVGTAQADDYAATIETFQKSVAVQPFFQNAYGYVVFPTVGKGGIGIGGAYGKGQVYKGGKVTGEAKLMKATIGFQLGGHFITIQNWHH